MVGESLTNVLLLLSMVWDEHMFVLEGKELIDGSDRVLMLGDSQLDVYGVHRCRENLQPRSESSCAFLDMSKVPRG